MADQQGTNRNPVVVLRNADNLPSPALGPGQLKEGDFAIAQDIPALYYVNGDGIMIPRTLQQLGTGQAPVVGAVNTFVNSATGSDVTGTGSATSPVQTIGRAFQIATLNPSFAGNTITLQNVGVFPQSVDEVWNVPFAVGGAPPLRLVGSIPSSGTFTATGGSTGTFVPLAAGTITGVFPSGAFTKHFATWISGPNTGTRFSILSNTAGVVTANTIFAVIPGAGDQFTVEFPGAEIAPANSLTLQGGPIRLDNLQIDVPAIGVGLHAGVGLNFLNAYVQENGVIYIGKPGGGGSAIVLCKSLDSGTSNWDATEAACGCIYDGSFTGGVIFVDFSSSGAIVANPNFDTAQITMRAVPSGATHAVINGVFQIKNAGVAVDRGASLTMVGLLGQNLTGAIGVGPGCIAARASSELSITLSDFEGCAAGKPLVSLDQSRGVFGQLTGANAASSFVLSLKSASSASVTGITVSAGGVTTADLGAAGATVISGVVPATTDIASPGTQLCLVGAPT